MARSGSHRSARTGRYVPTATAARHPRTTITERGGNRSSGWRRSRSRTSPPVR